jgi:UTP--glucose-1-phosphate uridylyltransferase
MDAVIPAGGLGTRLLPLTRALPKEMLPVGDKPALQYVVEELASAGVDRVLLVTSTRKTAIEDYFEAEPVSGVRIQYVRQPHPRGLGDALLCGEQFAGGHAVVVAHGDALVDSPPSAAPGIVPRLIGVYERTRAGVVLAVQEVPDAVVSRSGIVVGARTADDEPLFVQSVIEKPDPGVVASRTAIMGRYVLGPEAFDALRETAPDDSGEVQLASALERLISAGVRVLAMPLGEGERRHDIGSLEGYCATFIEYALRHPQLGERLRSLIDE